MRSTVLWFFHRVSALRVLFSILTAVSLLPHICSVQLFISYYSLSPGAACIYKSCSSQPTPAVSLFVACFYTFDSWHAVHHGKLLSLLNDSRGSADVLSGEHTSSTPSAPSALPHISSLSHHLLGGTEMWGRDMSSGSEDPSIIYHT